MNHAALIARLCEASEGSAELSRECWEALTGEAHVTNFAGNVGRVCHNDDERWEELVPRLTTDLSAAWEEAKVRELEEQRDTAMTDRHDEMMDLRADRDRLARENEARWRDVAHEVPEEAQEVLMVRDGKTIHGAWIGESFWHSNQKVVAAYWMPLPKPIVGWTLDAARRAGGE